jgi:hypothetical protein
MDIIPATLQFENSYFEYFARMPAPIIPAEGHAE